MKQIVKRIVSDIKEYWTIAPIILALYVTLHRIMGAFCPSIWITGFSCPGCGMTRAFLFVMTGQFERAFRINPSIYLWIVYGLYFIIQRYIRGKAVKGAWYLIGTIAGVMLIVYIYGMIQYFPDTPPYVYSSDNIFAEYIPKYDELVHTWIMK